jgi:putative DNA primase/helicase
VAAFQATNPADCPDRQTALLLWGGQIAIESAGERGLPTLRAACLDMAGRAPLSDYFRKISIKSLLRCANDHLGERHSPETIDSVFFEAFPEQAGDDEVLTDADLDEATVKIDGKIETDAEIARLAKLPSVEYDRERTAAAKRLGIRASILDLEVKALRPNNGGSKGQGRQFQVPEIEPWPEVVDGSALLTEIAGAVRRYVVLPEGAAEIVAIWMVHTHCFNCFMHSPRLAITSPEKECGKTTLLDVAAYLVARPLPTSNATVSATFRVVEMGRPTLLIDEADTFLKENDELRGILNTGHRRGGEVLRTVGDDHEPRQFSTWAPAAIAMIGVLPDTLNDRSISCSMRRRRANERVESFRGDRVNHLQVLARKMARWAADHEGHLRAADPATEGLQNRAADNWRPLLAIADAAGGTWPDRMRKVAIAAVAARSEQSIRVPAVASGYWGAAVIIQL